MAGRRGFSLVELLVAMAIIGVLVGMFFVGAEAVKKKAEDARVEQTVNNIVMGIKNLKVQRNHNQFLATGYVTGAENHENYGMSATFIDLKSKLQITDKITNDHIGRELSPGDTRLDPAGTYVPIINKYKKEYFKAKEREVNLTLQQVVDAWGNDGNAIRYVILPVVDSTGNPVIQPPGPDGVGWRKSLVYSTGRDGTDDTVDNDDDNGDDIVVEVARYDVPKD